MKKRIQLAIDRGVKVKTLMKMERLGKYPDPVEAVAETGNGYK